jgi:Putative exporter of polyketide antibiotics
MFAGTWTLIKLILRRDRVKLPIWILLIVLFTLSMIPLLKNTYGSQETIDTLYQTFQASSVGLLMTGMMDSPTFGALFSIETVLWVGLAVAFMNTLLVIRHTRQNEEMGAQELILSGRVGHGSSLTAVLIVAFVSNLLIAIGLGIGMASDSIFNPNNAWLYAISMGLFGFTLATIAAIVAQLTQSARAANGILASSIGIFFLVRGIGDFLAKADSADIMQPNWVSNLSPFGWLQATRSLTLGCWSPLLVFIGFIIVAIPVAFWLLSKRDVGAGILPSRKGRARASRLLKTPLGITIYLQKNIFVGWLIGALALALTVGMLVPEMTNVYSSSEDLMHMITALGGAGAMVPTFLSVMLSFTAVLALAYVIQGLGRLRHEETSGHLESLLATKLSRLKWFAYHFTVVMIGGALILVASGALLSISASMTTDIGINIVDYILAGLSYWPMLFIFGAIYTTLFSLIPHVAGLIVWIYYGFVAFMSWLGPILKLEQYIMDMSLMSHLAVAPSETIVLSPIIIMSLVAVALTIIGTSIFCHRNIDLN